MESYAIVTQNLSRHFGSVHAVENLNLEVPHGTVFGFLGPNGAGKTTTIRLLLGLLAPTAGSARVLGYDSITQADEIRARTGALLEHHALYERMSAEDNLEFYGLIYRMSAARRKIRIQELLEHIGLWDRRKDLVGKWSRGMKQKLAVARALFAKPALVFLDEPTAGLDVASRVMLHDLMRELQAEGTTILLATHDMAEASEMASRVAILLSGKIAAAGTPLELTATGAGLTKISVHTEGGCLAKATTAFPAVRQTQRNEDYLIYYSTDIGPTISALIDYINAQGDPLVDLRVERPTLEDRFLEITTKGGGQ